MLLPAGAPTTSRPRRTTGTKRKQEGPWTGTRKVSMDQLALQLATPSLANSPVKRRAALDQGPASRSGHAQSHILLFASRSSRINFRTHQNSLLLWYYPNRFVSPLARFYICPFFFSCIFSPAPPATAPPAPPAPAPAPPHAALNAFWHIAPVHSGPTHPTPGRFSSEVNYCKKPQYLLD
eukprot:470550-Hanusia_phi.AAC.4